MKQCPYCGKEYPDDVMVCAIDGEVLKSDAPEPEAVAVTEAVMEKVVDLRTYPDYEWKASDGWKCLGLIVLLQLIFEAFFIWLPLETRHFWNWYSGGLGNCIERLLIFSLWVGAAVYFARTDTRSAVVKGFGLDQKPSEYVWWGIVGALALRGLGQFILAHRWSSGVSVYDYQSFKGTPGAERYLFLVPLVVFAPLFEETVNRGFIYKAFRGSYSVAISMLLIIGWTIFTHWNQYYHSWMAGLVLSLFAILLCYLREKSGSLWDCILCHFAFNASSLFI